MPRVWIWNRLRTPAFYDKLERARCQSTDRIGILKALGETLQQSITLFSLSIGVMLFSPFMFIVMILAVVPAFFGESYFASLSYSLAYSQVPLRREMDYLRDLGTKKESAKELKLFKIGDFLYDRFSQINDEIIGRNRTLAKRRMRSSALFVVLGSLGYYGVYAALLFRTIKGGLTLGELTFLAGALAGCSRQVQAVFSNFTDIAHQALFLSDLFGLFAVKPKIRNAANAHTGAARDSRWLRIPQRFFRLSRIQPLGSQGRQFADCRRRTDRGCGRKRPRQKHAGETDSRALRAD